MRDQQRCIRRLLDLVLLVLAIEKLSEWLSSRKKSVDDAGLRVVGRGDVGNATPESESREWSRILHWPWVRENALWLVGLIPVALVCYRIFYVSGGDPVSMRLLVTNLDVVQIAVVTVLSLLPVGLFYAGLVVLERVFFDVPGENLPAWACPIGLGASFIGFILMNRSAANWILIGLGVFVVLALVVSYFVKKHGGPRLVIFGGAIVVLSVIQALIASSDHWLPAENVLNNAGDVRTGFVVDESEGEVTIQWYRGPMEVIEGAQIASRSFCTFEKDRDKYVYKFWPSRLWYEQCVGRDYQKLESS